MKEFTFFVLLLALLLASLIVNGLGEGLTQQPLADVRYSELWNSITSNSSVEMKIQKEGIAVTKLSFVSEADLVNAEIDVVKLQTAPPVGMPDRRVFQYISITKKNIGDEDIKDINVEFAVEKKWLDLYNATYEEVVLLGYEEKWNELTSNMINSDILNYYFNVELDGLSYFAIALKEPGTKINETAQVNEATAANITVSLDKTAAEPKGGLSIIRLGAVIFFVIIISAIILFVVKKRKKEKKVSKEIEKKSKKGRSKIDAVTFEEKEVEEILEKNKETVVALGELEEPEKKKEASEEKK